MKRFENRVYFRKALGLDRTRFAFSEGIRTRHRELGRVQVYSMRPTDLHTEGMSLEEVVAFGAAYWDADHSYMKGEEKVEWTERHYFMQRSLVEGETVHADNLRRLGWVPLSISEISYNGATMWRKEGNQNLDLYVFEDEALSPVFLCEDVRSLLKNGAEDLDECLRLLREVRDANDLIQRVLFPSGG